MAVVAVAGKNRATSCVWGLLLATPLILGVFMAGYLFGQRSQDANQSGDQNIGCTQEAKICPDGLAIGRDGPDCEFPDCPEEPNTSSRSW